MVRSKNVVVCLLAKRCKVSISALTDKFHIGSNDSLNASVSTVLRDMFWFYLSNLI